MLLKIDYIELEYSNKDEPYIHDIVSMLNKISLEIINFFEIDDINVKVKLWDSLDDFRKLFNNLFQHDCNEWTCGFAHYDDNNYYVETLSLDEYKKTLYHENHTINDLIYLILHEFVHSCHQRITNNRIYSWLAEGAACYISHQIEKVKDCNFNISLDMLINGGCNYTYYYLFFKYVYEKYGRKYILDLFKNKQLLIETTPELYEETKKYYKSI